MKVGFKAFGNDPVYEVFSVNTKHLPLSRVLIPVCLERGIMLTYEGKHETTECSLNLAHIVVEPTDQAQSSSAYIYASQDREMLIGEEIKVVTDIFTQISIHLPKDEYQRLFDSKPNSIELEMDLEVEGDEIRFSEEGFGLNLDAKLHYIRASVKETEPIPSQIVGELKQIYRKRIRGNLKARYGQLSIACEQFAESIASGIKKISANIPDDVERCTEILNCASSAFTVEEMNPSDKDARVMWQHQNILGMIRYGDAKNREQLNGFDPKTHEIEELADKLLSLKLARSKLLENCILDALVFAENIAFARIIFSKTKTLGMRMAEPLKGTEDDSLFIGLSKILGQGLVFYAKEIIFIAITYGVAFMLAAGDVTAAWVITSLFTVFRWYSKGESNKEDPKYKEAVLLDRMIAFYASVDINQDRINPELVKRKLLDLEANGAVYSRFVYEIIDRKLQDSKK